MCGGSRGDGLLVRLVVDTQRLRLGGLHDVVLLARRRAQHALVRCGGFLARLAAPLGRLPPGLSLAGGQPLQAFRVPDRGRSDGVGALLLAGAHRLRMLPEQAGVALGGSCCRVARHRGEMDGFVVLATGVAGGKLGKRAHGADLQGRATEMAGAQLTTT